MRKTDGAIKRKSRPFEKLSGTKTFYGWNSGKCLVFAKAAVEVMLSGRDTEDISAEQKKYIFLPYVLFIFLKDGFLW